MIAPVLLLPFLLGGMAELTSSKHLLLDTRVVASSAGAKLVPGQALKSPHNPLLSDANNEQMRPWEVRYDNMQPNVFFDGGVYKLWYSSWTTCDSDISTWGTSGDACSTVGFFPCSGVSAPKLAAKGRICALMYAESSDGIEWTKPALGVINDTSTVANTSGFGANNIVVLDNTGSGVLVDEHAPPSQRYKLFGELDAPGGHKHSRALAVSSDGIHWNTAHFAGSSTALDRHGTANNLVFDPEGQRFVGFGRPSNSPFRTEGVAVSLTSDYLGKWAPSVPCGLEKGEDKQYQPDALVAMTAKYENVWLGFANMLNVTLPTAATSAGTTELELVWSPDLIHWKYVAHGTPFIPRGPPKSYDCCQIFGVSTIQQPSLP